MNYNFIADNNNNNVNKNVITVPRPYRSNFRSKMPMRLSERRYPNDVSAVFNSFRSILPELSESNDRKQFCQSVTYFHKAPKSWKLTVPLFSRSNMPSIKWKLSIYGIKNQILIWRRSFSYSWQGMTFSSKAAVSAYMSLTCVSDSLSSKK